MSTATENNRRDVVWVIGEGSEDGDVFAEMLDLMRMLHEFTQEAERTGKSVKVTISLTP